MFHRTRRLAERVLRRLRSGEPTLSLSEWEKKHEPLVAAAVEKILPHLPEGGLFLDIGANVGAFSRLLRERRPDVRGILFEPVGKYYGICAERFKDDEMVEVVNIALGDEDAERTIFKAPHNYGANSLVEEIMYDRRPESFVRPDTVIEKETITLRRVENFLDERGISHVDVVKSDTEGYDYAVLDGIRPWIQRTGCYPVMLAEVLQEEFHPLIAKQRAALEAFFELGYGRVDVDKELNWLVGDVLLLPQDKAANGSATPK